ncbi:MAG: glutamate-5-semialdehyde dehydrogenase [Spirochaetes bacterium]|nr:glutamate-5-semialdehyde dehydrogenase [Spirochaetota bacterium]
MDIETYIESLCREAKEASIILRSVSAMQKNNALESIAQGIDTRGDEIIRENGIDCEQGRKAGLSKAFLDRLTLNESRIQDMVTSLKEIAAMEDPIGEIAGLRRPQGFLLEKVRVPIGVVAMIFESRPNVTVDSAALCLKSGNSVVLRGGSDALSSNRALVSIIREGLSRAGLPENSVQLVERSEHTGVSALVRQNRFVDLIIPRGGESLIKRVVDEATVPVIKHFKGVCHLFVDEDCDLLMAKEVVHNAKVQRPATCNALETLLVHEKVASLFLPRIRERLGDVELRGCARTREILTDIGEAHEEDFFTEYLDMRLSVKIVDSLDDAIEHIERYGSSHTDGILSNSIENIERFVSLVDSAVVMVNASTRLSDGGVFGLGAEIGISTDKLHARGPMGLKELTTYKWIVLGNGQVRP